MNPEMYEAVHEGDLHHVMDLVKSGEDLTATDDHGETALEIAFDLGHEEMARILSSQGGGSMAHAYAHRHAERARSLEMLGLDAHEVHMRMKQKECFVCRKQMNFARMYIDHKKFCGAHDGQDDDMMHAIETINGM